MADITGLIAGLPFCPDIVTPAADRQMLELIVSHLVGIPGHNRRAGNNPLWMALATTGVQTFLGDLTMLTEEDIMNLKMQPTRALPNPPIMHKHKTVIVIAAYHHYSQQKGASIDMRLFPVKLFDHFYILFTATMRKSFCGK